MTQIEIVIIDDEEPARNLIKHYLKNYSEMTVVGEASNGFDGMKIIKELNPQLIFLDIQMPKLNGFEMLELVESPPEIIFSTAFDQYAIRAFESNAIDYLLKPYSKERFDSAIQKALTRIGSGVNNKEALQGLQQSTVDSDILSRIAVKDRRQILVIPIQEIIHIEAEGDYVKLHTSQGSFLKEKTMKYLEEHLPPQQFIRIHRSSIVNVDEVAKIELYGKENYWVHLKNGVELKASSNGYKLLKETVKL